MTTYAAAIEFLFLDDTAFPLNHLATDIVRLCSGETVDVALPKDLDNDGVPPVPGADLAQHEDIVDVDTLADMKPDVFDNISMSAPRGRLPISG